MQGIQLKKNEQTLHRMMKSIKVLQTESNPFCMDKTTNYWHTLGDDYKLLNT